MITNINMKYLIFSLLLAIVFISSVSASTLILVDPYENRQLPQASSNVSLDLTGLHRTYLYCTWQIDGMGEELEKMNSTLCPNPQINFTFEDDENYYARIDYIEMEYNQSIVGWQLVNTGMSGEKDYHYYLQVPEPHPTFLITILNTIRTTIRNILCSIFPGLGICP